VSNANLWRTKLLSVCSMAKNLSSSLEMKP